MIRLAIAGLGRWGKVLVDSVQDRSPRVKFTHAVTRDPAKAADYCRERQLVAVPSLDAVLSDPNVDGIVLATPHSHHADQIVQCARAGKAVFVEKPVTLTLESAQRAVAAVQAAGTILAAGFNRRWMPAVQDLKRLISDGALGTVLHVETNFSANVAGRYTADMWRVAPGESPAGGLAGMGIHQIDTIIHLAAPITEVYAQSLRRVLDVPMDDTTMVTFRLADGGSASLLMVTATAPIFRIHVLGSKGRAEISSQADKRGVEALDLTWTDGRTEQRTYEPVDIERAELEAFGAAISGAAPYPVTLDEVLNGVAAFEAVAASATAHAPIATGYPAR